MGYLVRPLSDQERQDAKVLFQGETLRDEVWWSALNAKDAQIVGCFSESLVGVASYREADDTVKLISISSLHKGAGTALVRFIRNATKKPLWCKGIDSAEGFYVSVGMKKKEALMVGDKAAHIYVD